MLHCPYHSLLSPRRLEEVAAPYYVFKAAGAAVTLASMAGGKVPMDAGSLSAPFLTPDAEKFQGDGACNALQKERKNVTKQAQRLHAAPQAVVVLQGVLLCCKLQWSCIWPSL